MQIILNDKVVKLSICLSHTRWQLFQFTFVHVNWSLVKVSEHSNEIKDLLPFEESNHPQIREWALQSFVYSKSTLKSKVSVTTYCLPYFSLLIWRHSSATGSCWQGLVPMGIIEVPPGEVSNPLSSCPQASTGFPSIVS